MFTRHLIETYHHAWTNGDFATAHGCLADDLNFQGSIDSFSKADNFIAALTKFKQMVSSVTIMQSFYDAEGAALLYDCNTVTPAGILRTAEFFTISDQKNFCNTAGF
ncbi:MAG: hypothetical protein HGB26_06835 [Desulfobulbaceae bacterium]|nr:hypothetical protein [Desulfobulbaceae bacterium]